MKMKQIISLVFVLALALLSTSAIGIEKQNLDTSKWKIKDIYEHLKVNGDKMPPEEAKAYAKFIVDCQEPKTGNFIDSHGGCVYSLKAYHLVRRFGLEPKYPLSVCEPRFRHEIGEEVSETMSVEGFRKWLDYIYKNYSAYSAGSLRGHFIEPHVFNLRNAGKPLESSPYIPILRKWLLDNQGENGFWNRPDDSDFNGWNGVMKMSGGVGKAGIRLPHPEKMIKTVLKHQDTTLGTFTSAGGCTNHNALHVARQCSTHNNMIMWQEVIRAMQRHAGYVQKRFDPDTGLFRSPPGYDRPPDPATTRMTSSEVGNIISYSQMLLRPENAKLIAVENQTLTTGQKPITREAIVDLLVKATGLSELAKTSYSEYVQAEHEKRYGNSVEEE